MRRANGSGTIFKLKSGKRRKPWVVRVTDGWDLNMDTGKVKQVVKVLGYYKTKDEATVALSEYLHTPYDIDTSKYTFKDVYERWFDLNIANKDSNYRRTITAAYAYCHYLYNIRFKDIRVYHLKDCMDKAFIIPTTGKDKGKKRIASAETKKRMKSLFNLIFDFAIEYEYATVNYARNFNISDAIIKEAKRNKAVKLPFTPEELDTLWENIYRYRFIDMILCQVYSGFRPQEICLLEVQNVDLENNMMVGGIKTESGTNRLVPIHPLIRDFIIERIKEANMVGSKYVFNDIKVSKMGEVNLTYEKYRHRFKRIMENLHLDHSPHEARHTFITMAKLVGVNEFILKKIVGHSISDITEAVYTHRGYSGFHNEMSKITRESYADAVNLS